MVSPELLRRYPYFAPIEDESLKKVAMIAEEQFVPAGTTMFRECDPADTMYIILDGEVNIDYVLGTGEVRTVDTLTEGDLLVWSALVEPYRCTGSGTAVKDTHLLAVRSDGLRSLCDEDPALGNRLMTQVCKLLSARLDSARVQLACVG